MPYAPPDRTQPVHAGAAPPPSVPGPPRPRDSLLVTYTVAVALTTLTAWVVYVAAVRTASVDLTGHVETMLPLARLGMLSSPIVVAFRGAVAAFTVWLVAGAMNDRLTLRTVASAVFLWIPVLEAPALIDALRVLTGATVTSWADAHVPLGLDALLPDASGRLLLFAQGLNLAAVAFTVLLARALSPRLVRGRVVAVPAAVAAAMVLLLLPLARG